MKQPTILLLAIVLLASGGMAQPDFPVDSMGRVTVISAGDTVNVFDQTNFLGTTPLIDRSISPGIHILRYFPVSENVWMKTAKTETLTVVAGGSFHLLITMPFRYDVTSEPFGATIGCGDSIVGKTPAILWLPAEIKSLRITLPGYLESDVFVTRGNGSIHSVLIPERGLDKTLQSSVIQKSTNRDNFSVYAAASLAVVSGVAAAYFKIKADNYYDDYRRTGYDGNLNKIRSYDRISALSMVVGELSLGTLTYLLLRR